MLKTLRSLFAPSQKSENPREPEKIPSGAPAEIRSSGADPFPLATTLEYSHGLPFPKWQMFYDWLETIPSEDSRAIAWAECELAWLEHLREALGSTYHLMRLEQTVILSSLDAGSLKATFAFIARTNQRILRLLSGIAEVQEWGHDILIIFDDDETYYNYVARFYPDDGEFAMSSGMHIGDGCSHFVTTKSDLLTIEPVIAHEMTHGCLSHLPIPTWLNEGIAVNTEHRICPPPAPLYSPREMHEKHLGFWGAAEIQEFWSGKSFYRSDDGNMLSYDLARILVAHFSADWDRFREFVLSANNADSGLAAAIENLGVPLGAAVASVMEQEFDESWGPNPSLWDLPREQMLARSLQKGLQNG
jgi:hypothetical protein